MLAPKITHQIWMQGWDVLPEKFYENVRGLHALNPEFQHMQWTDATLRAECAALGPTYLAKYDSFIHMISKVDFGRYVVLYRYGGISIDTDMEPLRPLHETPGVNEYDFILSASSIMGSSLLNTVNNALFIVVPEHPIMKFILDTIVGEPESWITRSLHKELFVQMTTGPCFLNYILYKYRDTIHVLDNMYFEPSVPTDKSIMNHNHELSWMSPFSAFVVKHWFMLFVSLVSLVLLVTVLFQSKHSIFSIGNEWSNHKSTDMGG
jgi:mannosyltransferase OCH1-like enzyme